MHDRTRMRSSSFRSDNRKSKIQNRKWGGIVASGVTFAMCGVVAQHRSPDRVKRNPGLVLSLLDSAALHPGLELRLQAFEWR